MKKSHIAIIIFLIALLSVAVGYVISIMLSLGFIEPRFEHLELIPLSDNSLVVVIKVKQIGANVVTILNQNKVLYNGNLASSYPVEDSPICYFEKLDMSKAGDEGYATFIFPRGNTWKSGMKVTISIQTEARSEGYFTTVNLP